MRKKNSGREMVKIAFYFQQNLSFTHTQGIHER